MEVLTIDIGGTNVKILATGHETARKFPSGRTMTPKQMVSQIKKLAADWKYEVVSIGYPGPVHGNHPLREPRNLGPGWVDFDFAEAFGCPVRVINDAAMQALGSYKGGTMLFIGLGTGLGSAVVEGDVVVPMELGHFSYKAGTYEDYVGKQGLKRLGKKKWRRHVAFGVAHLTDVFHPDDVVLGGGNSRLLRELPAGCRLGHNAFAFVGGFRLWKQKKDLQTWPTPSKRMEPKSAVGPQRATALRRRA